MVVERYSHVMHMVSNVEGEVDPALTPMQLLRATFPAGTVTGAPKVRSMEIIDELEPEKRGVYAGAAGYLGFNGNIDLAIAIRTGVVQGRQAARAGRRGHRRRLDSRERVARDAEQGARRARRGRAGARRPRRAAAMSAAASARAASHLPSSSRCRRRRG